MNLLADESVDQPIVERLRQERHPVISVAELSPSISDNEVLDLANNASALLLTSDKDFGELVFRQGKIHVGVVLLRLAGLAADEKSNCVVEVLRDREAELPGAFTVISPGMVRIRRGP